MIATNSYNLYQIYNYSGYDVSSFGELRDEFYGKEYSMSDFPIGSGESVIVYLIESDKKYIFIERIDSNYFSHFGLFKEVIRLPIFAKSKVPLYVNGKLFSFMEQLEYLPKDEKDAILKRLG